MTRDPARIDRICDLLCAYWHAHPDLRLGQIVGNFTPTVPCRLPWGAESSCGTTMPGDSYYVEDTIIEAALAQAAPPHLLPVCHQRGIGGRVAGDCCACQSRWTCENPKRVGVP